MRGSSSRAASCSIKNLFSFSISSFLNAGLLINSKKRARIANICSFGPSMAIFPTKLFDELSIDAPSDSISRLKVIASLVWVPFTIASCKSAERPLSFSFSNKFPIARQRWIEHNKESGIERNKRIKPFFKRTFSTCCCNSFIDDPQD